MERKDYGEVLWARCKRICAELDEQWMAAKEEPSLSCEVSMVLQVWTSTGQQQSADASEARRTRRVWQLMST